MHGKVKDVWHLQVAREIRVHSSLQHTNIIGLFAAFQDAEGIYLVQVNRHIVVPAYPTLRNCEVPHRGNHGS